MNPVQGLEDGFGNIRYPNGNTLDATFELGKIQGHGVFRLVLYMVQNLGWTVIYKLKCNFHLKVGEVFR